MTNSKAWPLKIDLNLNLFQVYDTGDNCMIRVITQDPVLKVSSFRGLKKRGGGGALMGDLT